MYLLDVTGSVRPSDSRSHAAFRFQLKQPAEQLWIRFSYSPKFLDEESQAFPLVSEAFETYLSYGDREAALRAWKTFLPLKNLITLSLDGPNGYRGACHRHDPDQLHFISPIEASPGLNAGALPEGDWSVTLSFHAVVTESCVYEIQVWAEEEQGNALDRL